MSTDHGFRLPLAARIFLASAVLVAIAVAVAVCLLLDKRPDTSHPPHHPAPQPPKESE